MLLGIMGITPWPRLGQIAGSTVKFLLSIQKLLPSRLSHGVRGAQICQKLWHVVMLYQLISWHSPILLWGWTPFLENKVFETDLLSLGAVRISQDQSCHILTSPDVFRTSREMFAHAHVEFFLQTFQNPCCIAAVLLEAAKSKQGQHGLRNNTL